MTASKSKGEEKDLNSNSSKKNLVKMDVSEKADNSNGKYPKVVFLIILTELCERFSFYGLRTVLYIFFSEFIMLSADTSTALYHAYSMLCYFTPILGAIIADGYIGLYKTILSLSIVYFIGEVVVTLTSMRPLGAPNIIGPAIGLIIIGFGTGGIKPCVSAFGGNQFEATQTRFINNFFSVFYMSINIGSTIGTILTPIFRSDVKCFGSDCYPLAFGVPAAFMFFAILCFVAGTMFYKRRGLQGDGKNVVIETVKIICRAVWNKFFKRDIKKKKCLDYAETHHTKQSISDVRAFLGVAFVFIPVPIFWALYDQQGSRWTDQAIQLDGRIGSFVVEPDQMQAVNPILIIILIPLFDFIVYPLCAKINLFKRLLQRMVAGMCLACLAFLISSFLEYEMQQSLHANNPVNNVRALNLLPCSVDIYNQSGQQLYVHLDQASYLNNQAVNLPRALIDSIANQNGTNSSQSILFKYSCSNGLNLQPTDFDLTTQSLPKTLIFYLDANNEVQTSILPYDNTNPMSGFSQVKFSSINTESFGSLDPVLTETGLSTDGFTINSLDTSNANTSSSSSYKSMDYAFFDLTVKAASNPNATNSSSDSGSSLVKKSIYLSSGGRYNFLLFKNPSTGQLDYALLTDLYPISIHLAWQIIQIFVMAVAEILFSISGIAFAYSQAPATMKSACQALWYIDVAIGNMIVLIVAESRFIENQVYEYIFFAGVMAAATILFVILTLFYKYKDTTSSSSETSSTETKENLEKTNGHVNNVVQDYDNDSILVL